MFLLEKNRATPGGQSPCHASWAVNSIVNKVEAWILVAGVKGVMDWLTAPATGLFEWEGAPMGGARMVEWEAVTVAGAHGTTDPRIEEDGQNVEILEKEERRKGGAPFIWS